MVASKVAAIASTSATIAMSVASKGAAIATGLMSGAMGLFNAVILANPIVALIALVVGLAAWGLSLVDDWSPVSEFFGSLWEGIKSAFSGAWDLFVTLMSWSPIGLIIQAWSPLLEFFGGLWGGIKTMASGFLDWIVSAVMGPINSLKDAMSEVWAWFSGDDKAAEVVKTVQQIAPDNAQGVGALSSEPSLNPVLADGRQSPKVLQTGFKQQNANAGYLDQSQTHFAITAAPGMDTEELAREVDKKLSQRDREKSRRGRGRFGD